MPTAASIFLSLLYTSSSLHIHDFVSHQRPEGFATIKSRARGAMTHRLVVPVIFFPELRAEQTTAILLFGKLALHLVQST